MVEKNPCRLSVKKILNTLVVIVIILNSGYYRTTISDSYLPLMLLIFTTVMCYFANHGKNRIRSHFNPYLAVILVGVFCSGVINFSFSNILSGGRVAVTMLCSYIILNKTSTEEIFRIYCKMIRIFIWLSLLLKIILQAGYTHFPVLGSYYDLFVVSAKVNGSRAMGPFWEPGVFATAIIFSLIIDIYFSKRKASSYKIVLYIIGVVLTKSTAGIMILMFIFFAYLLKITKFEKKKTANVLFVVAICIGFAFYEEIFQGLNQLNPLLFGKLVEISLSTTATRMNAPLINLEIFLKHPVFGFGFTDAATEFAKYMGYSGSVRIVAQTSTSTQILSAIGASGLAYTAAILSFVVRKENKYSFIAKVVIISSMLLIVNKEPHIYNAMTWFLIFYMSKPSEISLSQENKAKQGMSNCTQYSNSL